MSTKTLRPMPACATLVAYKTISADFYGSYDQQDNMSNHKNDWGGWYASKLGFVHMHSRRTLHAGSWNTYEDHIPGVSSYSIHLNGWHVLVDEPIFRLPESTAKIAALILEVLASVRPVGNKRAAFETALRDKFRQVYPFPVSPTNGRFYENSPKQRTAPTVTMNKAA